LTAFRIGSEGDAVNDKPRTDRIVTAILGMIWFGAVAVVAGTRDDIPLHLLAIGTVFFVMLVPAMKELVRNVDRFFSASRQRTGTRD
jgi:hypothetical protein